MTIKLINWNVEWAKPDTPRGSKVLDIIRGHHPNVACITETFADQFEMGHTICSAPDYG